MSKATFFIVCVVVAAMVRDSVTNPITSESVTDSSIYDESTTMGFDDATQVESELITDKVMEHIKSTYATPERFDRQVKNQTTKPQTAKAKAQDDDSEITTEPPSAASSAAVTAATHHTTQNGNGQVVDESSTETSASVSVHDLSVKLTVLLALAYFGGFLVNF